MERLSEQLAQAQPHLQRSPAKPPDMDWCRSALLHDINRIFCKYSATKSLTSNPPNISEANMNSCHFNDKNPTVLMVTDLRGPLKGLLSGIESLSLWVRSSEIIVTKRQVGWSFSSDHLLSKPHLPTALSNSNPGPGMLENLLLSVILQPYAWPSSWVIYFFLLSLPCPSLLQILQVFQGKGFASKNAKVSQLRHGLQPCNLVQNRWPDEFPYVCIWNSIWI